MSESGASGKLIKRVTATNGVTYGPAGMAAAWGRVGCPIVPRAYRALYGESGAPQVLKDLVGDAGLSLSDLDRRFWDRSSRPALSKGCRQIVGRELGRLDCPSGAVALPAGLPLAWVAGLPLRTRTHNAIARLIWDRGKGPLDHSLLIEDVMAQRAVGTGTLIDLLCVLESAELDARALQSMGPDVDHGRLGQRMNHEQRCLDNLATWALPETDAVTLGDALALLVARRPR